MPKASVRERPLSAVKDWNEALQLHRERQQPTTSECTPKQEKLRGRESRADERR